MTFTLRDYQAEMLRGAHNALQRVRRVLIQSPTGSGKTGLAAYMLGSVSRKGMASYFLVHRQELIEQTVETFERVGIPAGVIAAGFPPSPLQKVQICSVNTLANRLDRLPAPALCVWDEAHHTAAAGWRKIMAHYGQVRHVGLTATPQRLDGRGLDDLFEELVLGPSVSWLIEQGWLSRYRAFSPTVPDMAGVHTRAGDFARDEVARLMDKGAIMGDAVQHYLRLARGQQGVAFCCSIEHSEHMASEFRAAGVSAAHLDGKVDKRVRAETVRRFKAGEIDVLTNVDLFGEGFDLPSMAVSMLMRPTKSLGLYLQQVGRALRPDQGKEHAFILDHAGNIARHGLPDDERAWTLAGRRKQKKSGDTILVRRCPECFAVHAPRPACPECGYIYEVEARQVRHVEGDLKELDVKAMRAVRRAEEQAARTVDDLISLGISRGYNNPERWAEHVAKARASKRGRLAAERADSAQRRAEAQYEFYLGDRT